MTEPTHLLLIPVDPLTMQANVELTDRLRSQLPPWVTPVPVSAMRGDALLLPIADPTPPRAPWDRA